MISVGGETRPEGHLAHPGKVGGQTRQTVALSFFLVIATFLLYYPVSHHPFSDYDDQLYVVGNAHVNSGFQADTLRWAFTTYEADNWHPLTWLSHALDGQLFGLDPTRQHEVNVLLHAINALVLFQVLLRATGFAGRSFMVAALFALHPVNVESVAWIAERKNLLSMLFFLLALGAYRWYALSPRIGRYLLLCLLYLLGLMSKPQVITLPFVLLLWDYWPLQRMRAAADGSSCVSSETTSVSVPPRSTGWLILEKLPLLALAAGSAVITTAAQIQGGTLTPYPVLVRLKNAILSYERYVATSIWPSRLAAVYPHPGFSLRWSQVLLPLATLIAITLAVMVLWRRRYLTVGWLWFLGTLVPMIGVVQVGVQGRADRYCYLPFIGLFIMISWSAAELATDLHIPVAGQAAAAVSVLLALSIVAHRQIGYWRDDVTLWTHTLQVTNANWNAEDNLGKALWKRDQIQEGLTHFLAASTILPADPVSNLNIGTWEAQSGNQIDAIERFKRVAVESDAPAELRAMAFNNMGQAYRELGDNVHARQSFAAAVKWKPAYFSAWMGLAMTRQEAGDLDPAIQAYSQALKIQPVDWGYELLARALQQSSRNEQAQAARKQAEALSDDFAATQKVADKMMAHRP